MARTPAREPISDLEAMAAMPGLDAIAELMAAADPVSRQTQASHTALLLLLGSRSCLGSLRKGEAVLSRPEIWSLMRMRALSVGRDLGEVPPTRDQLQAWRVRIRSVESGWNTRLRQEMLQTFTEISVPLVREAGLLPLNPPRWHWLDRANVLYADGTGFKALSNVKVDADGNVKGSRSKLAAWSGPGNRGPRISEVYRYKKELDWLPVVSVGVHGGPVRQRGVLALELFTDGNEGAAALDAIARVRRAAGSGAHGLVYDKLFDGRRLDQVMEMGLLPAVEMKQAAKNHGHLPLPEELQRRRYRKKNPKEPNVKTRVRLRDLGVEDHIVAGRVCSHALWGLDGTLVATPLDDRPTLDSPVARRFGLWRERTAEGSYTFKGLYEIPCGRDPFRVLIDHRSIIQDVSTRNKPMPVAQWLRPLPESDPHFEALHGWRQDAESSFSTFKNQSHRYGRSGSLLTDDFMIDMVATAMMWNATLWDDYVAGLTWASISRTR